MSEPVVHAVLVTDPIGLHARPVGQIVSLVKSSGADISLRRPGGPDTAAVSALKLLAMKVKTGETLEVVIDGVDAEQARGLAAEIEQLINEG
jgi:phosphotransferase system HPr (HPr) family protein